MSDLLSYVAFHGAVPSFFIALVLASAAHFASLPPGGARIARTSSAVLWTFGAVCVTYFAGDFFWYPDSDEPVRDVRWWAEYIIELLVIFAVTSLPASIYWARRIFAKR